VPQPESWRQSERRRSQPYEPRERRRDGQPHGWQDDEPYGWQESDQRRWQEDEQRRWQRDEPHRWQNGDEPYRWQNGDEPYRWQNGDERHWQHDEAQSRRHDAGRAVHLPKWLQSMLLLVVALGFGVMLGAVLG
jgi:hypothetical protein